MDTAQTSTTEPKNRPRNEAYADLSAVAHGGMVACGASFALVTYLEVGYIPQSVGVFAVYTMAILFVPLILGVVASAVPSLVLLVRGARRHRLRVLTWYGVVVTFLILLARIADVPTNGRASFAVVLQILGLVASCAIVAAMPLVWLRHRKT